MTDTLPIILNVDDSEAARYVRSRVLKQVGFTVLEAASGGEALEMARKIMPALIILDVKLPDINGMEVCRRLKADPATQSILILQTSASFIHSTDKVRSLEGGADNYLAEPIDSAELVANVRALLRLWRVERELREASERKTVFIATLAHELRNPLQPIRTAAELLCRLDPDPPAEQAAARQIIIRHADHLARMVDDLLDVSRISRGQIKLRNEHLELKSFVEAAIEIVSTSMSNNGHTLDVRLPDNDVWLWGDGVRLAQILTNLLINAAKFTPLGGHISILATVDAQDLSLVVSDDGIGIAAESLKSIFDLFVQSAGAHSVMHEGLGIGLSLVNALADLHGGKVTVVSEGAGQGSVFTVKLPLSPYGQQSQVRQDVLDTVDSTTPKRVLIVDDNIDAADMLGALLMHAGHEVLTVYNGKDALTASAEFGPDVTLLDIGLPDISGLEVARQLRQSVARSSDSLLVALTGYGQSEDRLATLAAGFDEHLVKPLDFSRLNALGLGMASRLTLQ